VRGDHRRVVVGLSAVLWLPAAPGWLDHNIGTGTALGRYAVALALAWASVTGIGRMVRGYGAQPEPVAGPAATAGRDGGDGRPEPALGRRRNDAPATPPAVPAPAGQAPAGPAPAAAARR
jgi:hypothetical protein